MGKKITVSLLLILIVLTGALLFINSRKESLSFIDSKLQEDAYSYLPDEALNFIKKHYNETGELIYTEKNKIDNVRYLNPRYIEYLSLSDEEKEKVGAVPTETVIDYIYNKSNDAESTPSESYFNLSDPSNNYTTPMKNQRNLGICWAYATIEAAETFLMYTNNEPYQEGVSEILSVRQLDYITSTLGIKDYVNKYGIHSLGKGSTFTAITPVLADGISLFDSSWKYDNSYSYNQLEMVDVFDDSLSKYELNSTIEMPVLNVKSLDLNNQNDLDKYNSYISKIKEYIKTYGGPYVVTQAPLYSCSAINSLDQNHYIIDTDSTCKKDVSHAMQIVGWDDNYSYKYCISGDMHIEWTNECSNENTVTGTGAWIIRNSWGEDEKKKYTYLTYNSIDTEYDFITSLNKSSDKEWDYVFSENNGNVQINDLNDNFIYKYDINFASDFKMNAKIIKIKFNNKQQNNDQNVYISLSGKEEDFVLIENVKTDYPGYYTIDLSSDNYVLNNKSKIRIIGDRLIEKRSISILTKEQEDYKSIITKDKIYMQSDDILEDGLYKVNLYSDTYNIDTNSEIEYQLFDQDGNDITSEMIVDNNKVTSNMINSTLHLPGIKNKSYFTVKTIFDGNVMSTSKLTVEIPKPSIGSGTKEDPYVIMTPQDLYTINYNLNSYFVLGNDIDLTYDTQNENGLYYNSGKGWEAIGNAPFSGNLDGYYNGKIHKIIGLKTNSDGLFYLIESGKSIINIKNIIFENAIANNSNILAHFIIGDYGGKVNIENIAVVNSTLNDSNTLASKIYSYGKNSVNINNYFVDSIFNINSGVSSGIVWGAESYETYTTDASINISNVQILGRFNNTDYNVSGLTPIIRFLNGNVVINNVIFNNNSYSTPYLFARMSESSSGNKPILNNIYYLNEIVLNYFDNAVYEENNVTQKTIGELKNESSYDDWEGFDDSWIISEYDGVGRIPILKFVSFNYSSFNEINVNVGETVNIYDYVNPSLENAKYLSFDTITNDYIELTDDGTITGVSHGTTNISVVSNYDGFEDNIVVNVFDDNKRIVRFYSNDESNKFIEQVVDKSTNTNLDKNSFIKTGYKFKEWNTKADGTGDSYGDEEEININDNLNLYIQWEPITYKVKFHSNYSFDETVIQEIKYNTRVQLTENTFNHENNKYRFKEWNTDSEGKGKAYQNMESVFNLSSVDGDIIDLYAIWQSINPIISFDSNGGTGFMGDIEVNLGESVILPSNTFEREGYYFAYWNTMDDDSGTKYQNREMLSPTSDMILYAIWRPIKYTVSWYNEDQTKVVNGTNTYDEEYTVGDYKWTLPEGYEFVGWNTKEDGTGTMYKKGDKFKNLSSINNSTVKLYAIIESIYYKISFDPNGGTGNMEDLDIEKNVATLLPDNLYERYGYNFTGWNTKEDGTGTDYGQSTEITVTSGFTLYAMWTPLEYKVVFNSSLPTQEYVEQILTYDKSEKLSKLTFVKPGYRFAGWCTKSYGSGGTWYINEEEVININPDMSNYTFHLYARWEPIQYTVFFFSNTDSESLNNQTIEYAQEVKLLKNSFENEGYVFTGWNTERDGSGTPYSDEQSVRDLSIRDGGIINLYAQWQEKDKSINIKKYEVDQVNKYINRIPVNTTKEEFLSNIEVEGLRVEVDTIEVKHIEVIYTGGRTKIYDGDKLIYEFINVVTGDINGDEEINSADLLKERQHLLGINILEGFYFLAADINKDNEINSADLLRIRQHLIGTLPIE